MNKKQVGLEAEQTARKYLEEQGLTFVESNFSSRFGEIDIVMKDNSHRVFIEVRVRNNTSYTSAVESVDFRKQNKLRKTALFYLQKNNLLDKVPCRFDVIAIEKNHIQWIKNAF